MNTNIAYVDDLQENLDMIQLGLSDDFKVNTFLNPDILLSKLPSESYEAIIIDLHMPAIDGFSLYEKIIENPDYNGCPILIISVDNSETARIGTFTLGAVDFLTRDMPLEEIKARIKSKIIFYQKHRTVIEFGNLNVNLTQLRAFINQRELGLTFIEFKLLCLFLRNYPEVITKDQIGEHVWNKKHVLDATIYTHISNLNGKLEDWDHVISGLKSKGFQLLRKAELS